MVSGDLLLLWIMGLRPFTVYNVSVFANTSEGAGPAETTSFTTLQAGEESCVIITCHKARAIVVIALAIVYVIGFMCGSIVYIEYHE